MPTVVELKKQAKEAGIIGYSRMKKSQLEAALKGPVKKVKATVKASSHEKLEQQLKQKKFSTASIKAIKSPKEWERLKLEFNKIQQRSIDLGGGSASYNKLQRKVEDDLSDRLEKGLRKRGEDFKKTEREQGRARALAREREIVQWENAQGRAQATLRF